MLQLRVLSWNLGPGNARWQDLAAVLAGWEWDVAVLRRLPAPWPLPLATALDAEFRYGGGPGRTRLRHWLSFGALSGAASPGATVDAVIARRDRIVSEWPADARRAQRTGVHAARLACGVWIGSLHEDASDPVIGAELPAVIGDDALVLAGPGSASGRLALSQVAQGGGDALWATAGLRPVSGVDVLAGGQVRGNPPLAVTLAQRGRSAALAPDPEQPDSAAG